MMAASDTGGGRLGCPLKGTGERKASDQGKEGKNRGRLKEEKKKALITRPKGADDRDRVVQKKKKRGSVR